MTINFTQVILQTVIHVTYKVYYTLTICLIQVEGIIVRFTEALERHPGVVAA